MSETGRTAGDAARELVARAAHEGVQTYLAARIDGYERKPWEVEFSADRDVRYAEADAVLAALAESGHLAPSPPGETPPAGITEAERGALLFAADEFARLLADDAYMTRPGWRERITRYVETERALRALAERSGGSG